MKFRRSALEFLVPRRVGFLSVCRIFTFSCAALLSLVCRCHAAELTDVNGDGQIMVLAFGDSITAGVGSSFGPSDFVETVEGAAISTSYPALLSGLLSVRVANSGIPGEEFTSEGFYRFVDEVRQNAADAVVFLEGANDAVFLVSSNEYQEKLQKLINAMHVLGVQFVALTQTVPCCDHSSLEPFTRDFSSRVRLLGALNDIDVVDVESLGYEMPRFGAVSTH